MGKRFLIVFLRKHAVSYTFGLIFMLLSSFVQTLFPQVIGNIVNILQTSHFRESDIYREIVYILFIAFGTFLTTFVWRNLVIGNARKLECDLREKLFDQFERLTPAYYARKKTGDLIAYAINDIGAVRQTCGPALAMAINGVAVCVIAVVGMVRVTDWQMTALALLPIPVMVFVMVLVGMAVKKRFRVVQQTFASISDRVNERINGIRVIKTYVQEESEIADFEQLNNRMVEANLSMVRVSAVLSPLIELCFTVSFAANLIIGGSLVLNGNISLGNFVAFNGYLTVILAPVLSIGRVITIVQRGLASLGRLDEILDEQPQVVDSGDALVSKDADIEFKNFSFTYPGSQYAAVRDISLTIPSGGSLGIIGTTGAGKSTVVNVLLRLFDYPPGGIEVGGTDINSLRLESLRDAVGVVPQEIFLFRASIADNISFFRPDYAPERIRAAARAADILDDIEALPDQFDTVIGERGLNLSGGQKQRISIARALIADPQILILDDALSAVDTVTENRILNNLQRVRKGKTTIVIGSRISAVLRCDNIVVLKDGMIIEQGNHAQLLTEGGLYRELYQEQHQAAETTPNTAF